MLPIDVLLPQCAANSTLSARFLPSVTGGCATDIQGNKKAPAASQGVCSPPNHLNPLCWQTLNARGARGLPVAHARAPPAAPGDVQPAPSKNQWRKRSELNAQGLRSPVFETGAVADRLALPYGPPGRYRTCTSGVSGRRADFYATDGCT